LTKGQIPLQIVKSGVDQGATDVVAKLIEYDRTMIRFSNNEITVSKNYREAVVDVFIMIEKQRAGSTIPLAPIRTLESGVKRLIEMAKITPPADVYAPLPEGPFSYDPSIQAPSKISTAPDRLVGYVEKAIDEAREMGAKKVAGSLITSKSRMDLATSGNVSTLQEKASLEISVRAFASDIASGHFVSVAEEEDGFRPREAGRIAGEIAHASLNPSVGEAGRYTALLGPLVFADLVNQVGSLSSAFLVDAGRSFLINKIGAEVASDRFTLTDDPTFEGTYGARAFDDEGVPARRNVIVDKGVLRTYLHNSTTAKKFDEETTGNAGLISPRPWNLVVEPGNETFEELIAEIDDGIYVTNDWYLRYQNYQTGDFSTIPRDGMFRIKHGRIENPIRELRMSDNMLSIFKNIRNLSKGRYWIKWWEVDIPTLTPYAVVEDLNFTKSTM
jgi:PmbA protein